ATPPRAAVPPRRRVGPSRRPYTPASRVVPDGILTHVANSATPDRPAPASSRGPRDLVLSLLVLLIPTVLLVGAYQIVAGRTEPVPVDQSQEIDAARRAGFDVAEPTGLGAEWVPVSAVFRQVEGGATLRLGYLTPAGAPVQVVESTVAADQVLVQELSDGGTPPVPTGVVTVAGSAWERYPGRDGETALVRREPERILLVVGRADESELRQLATALAGWRGATPAALYRGWPGRPGSSGPA